MPSLLRKGARGNEVVQLQQLLNAKVKPSPKLSPDGVFGPKTEAAVRQFQSQNRLSVDGIVGPKTWAALQSGGVGGGAVPPGTPAAPGTPGAAPVPPALGGAGSTDAPWVTIGRREIGVKEKQGTGENHPRILEYIATFPYLSSIKWGNSGKMMDEVDETPWCACFVNWCLLQAGKKGGPNARAKDWLSYGTALSEPRLGAIAVVYHAPNNSNASTTSSGYHVAFWTGGNKSRLTLLGGNQSNQVSEKDYGTYWTLKGLRWPN